MLMSLLRRHSEAAKRRAIAALHSNRLLHVAAATRVETGARRALALKTFQAVRYVALRLQTRGRGRRDRLLAVNRRRALAASSSSRNSVRVRLELLASRARRLL